MKKHFVIFGHHPTRTATVKRGKQKIAKYQRYKPFNMRFMPRYTYRVIQTIHMKLILLCVGPDWAILGSAKTALKFKYEI